MNPIRAVIFDLDGTLLDSEPLLDDANAAVLRRYGRELTPALRRAVVGRARQDSDRILAEAAGPSVDAREVGEARAALLDSSWERAALLPGAAELVARLARAGVPMAIATSSLTRTAAAKLKRHAELAAAVRTVVCVDHPAVLRPKPAPDTFLVAAAELAVEPGACLVFEDAPSGVRAALAAGMRVIAVPNPTFADDPAFAGAFQILRGVGEFDVGLLNVG